MCASACVRVGVHVRVRAPQCVQVPASDGGIAVAWGEVAVEVTIKVAVEVTIKVAVKVAIKVAVKVAIKVAVKVAGRFFP